MPFSEYNLVEWFQRWLVPKLQKTQPGILHSWNGHSYLVYRGLKDSGWLLCNERSCPHNKFQYDLLCEEALITGVPHQQDMRALDLAIEELHLADVIVAPSRYSAASYKDSGLQSKVRVNPLGGNVKYYERQLKPGTLKVLMVGNAFLRKGTHYLIEAFRLIEDPRAQLWIRGDVPDIYRRRLDDPRITIFPPVVYSKLLELYRNATVFVQPSVDEGFGMTVLEALGFGLPLVVTENVGSGELLSSEVAVTVPIRDPRAIAEAIFQAQALVGEGFDAARKKLLQMNSWSGTAERMLSGVYKWPPALPEGANPGIR
jgi:glycosyltransferase involved in cell wall biosynthesis